jgi:hypothetical protein
LIVLVIFLLKGFTSLDDFKVIFFFIDEVLLGVSWDGV